MVRRTRRSSLERRRVGFGEFRFDTPQLAAGSFIDRRAGVISVLVPVQGMNKPQPSQQIVTQTIKTFEMEGVK